MLALLIRKELLDHLLSLRFAMACVICPVVILSSVFVLTRDYRDAAQDYHTNRVMHRDQLEKTRFPHQLVVDGTTIDKPLNPMKVFFRGVDDEHTASVRVSGFAAPEIQADMEKNPVSLLFPIMDLTFVVGIIMSLLAIAFSYDAFSGEKELGTLKVVMSYAVPRDMLLWSKWLGGCLALMAPLLLSVVLGLLLTLLFPEIHLRGDHWLSLLLALGGAMLYLSTIYALGLFVSARTHLASTSIMVLLLIWVAMVLVYPNVSPYVAGMIRPTPTMQSVEGEKAKLQAEEMTRFDREWTPYIRQASQNNTPLQQIIDKFKEMQGAMTARVNEGRAKIDTEFRRRMDAQVDLARTIAKAAPTALFTVTACDLAGTGVQEKTGFRQSVGRYADQYLVWANTKYDPAIYDGNARLDVGDCPQYRYEAMGLGDRLGANVVDMLVMGVWNLVFLLLAYVSLMRYDVR
ncbi:MAG: ABC transporter permease [Candidatus Latescibacterota bacterium]